ncbi:hypothetical protein ACQR35_00620 [Pseudarthrobacter sp. J1738]|uniref:hypothetical protein n=1 Tax=unclassified Pseudarthrobacter TaxID=2647000 RepID=UPI003D2CB774
MMQRVHYALSSTGSKEHQFLQPVRVDSPGVGEHLQDHPEGVIQWEAKQPMTQTSTQWWEAGIFTTMMIGERCAELVREARKA